MNLRLLFSLFFSEFNQKTSSILVHSNGPLLLQRERPSQRKNIEGTALLLDVDLYFLGLEVDY